MPRATVRLAGRGALSPAARALADEMLLASAGMGRGITGREGAWRYFYEELGRAAAARGIGPEEYLRKVAAKYGFRSSSELRRHVEAMGAGAVKRTALGRGEPVERGASPVDVLAHRLRVAAWFPEQVRYNPAENAFVLPAERADIMAMLREGLRYGLVQGPVGEAVSGSMGRAAGIMGRLFGRFSGNVPSAQPAGGTDWDRVLNALAGGGFMLGGLAIFLADRRGQLTNEELFRG